MKRAPLSAVVGILALAGLACQEHVTFLAMEDLPAMESPERLSAAPNRVVGTIRKGELIRDAPVIRGTDYRYFEVVLPDGGHAYVRPSRQMQIYSEK